jgi:signal recognition particle GTPase
VVNYYGGGAWSFTEKVADSIKRTATGETIDAHRIPFVGRFKSEVNEYGDIQTFYERRTEVGQLHEEFINLPREEARGFYDEHGGKIALFDMATDLEKTLTELRKVRDAIEADERLTPEERDEQLDEIENAMDGEVDFFNLLYNQAEGAVQSEK